MAMLVKFMLLALVSAEEAKEGQAPGLVVPNWGKILGGNAQQVPQQGGGGGHPHKKRDLKVKAAAEEQHIHKGAELSENKKEVASAYKVNKVEHEATGGLPLCKGREYVDGSWKLLKEPQPKTFKCCSWDEGPGYWRHDTQKCMGASRRVNTGPAGSKFISIGGHGCMCDAHLDQVSEREMHAWTPTKCSLPAFNANSFCDALGRGKIHIFGDSTMQQASATLMNMLIGGHREEKQHCAPKIQFTLSDYLVADPEKSNERGESVDFSAEKYNADIYIVGLGAWIHSSDHYEGTINKVAKMIEKRQSEPNPPVFVWKTISGAGCGHINKMSVDNHDPSYTYDLFPKYDAMAREKLTPLGVKFVDLSPLYLRGDAHPNNHGDCLHFCAPGPVDIFPRLLHHVLQEGVAEA